MQIPKHHGFLWACAASENNLHRQTKSRINRNTRLSEMLLWHLPRICNSECVSFLIFCSFLNLRYNSVCPGVIVLTKQTQTKHNGSIETRTSLHQKRLIITRAPLYSRFRSFGHRVMPWKFRDVSNSSGLVEVMGPSTYYITLWGGRGVSNLLYCVIWGMGCFYWCYITLCICVREKRKHTMYVFSCSFSHYRRCYNLPWE